MDHQPMTSAASMFARSFFHGTRSDLKVGEMIVVGYQSNFTKTEPLSWVYLTGTLEDDPNLTDKKFPGNPTLSFRSRDPLRIIGEVTKWEGHAPDRVRAMKERVARAMAHGGNIID
jgi:hypothetical protein